MRYLGYFPSERDIVEKILPAVSNLYYFDFSLFVRLEAWHFIDHFDDLVTKSIRTPTCACR